ncbi:Alpha/Beta hydrolase protein [Mycena crocata]|nr:Alpha/Beta hydrolase protein [Mycena crocata]
MLKLIHHGLRENLNTTSMSSETYTFPAAAASEPPKHITVPAANGSPTASVILLHGLGGSGQDMSSLARHLQSEPALAHVQFFLPSAPTRAITASGGRHMPAWHDFYNFEFTGPEDEGGMHASAAGVAALVSLVSDPSRVVLGGFSQGGGLSLLTGLTAPQRLAGLAILSGRLPIRDTVKEKASEHATSLPIFYGMGTQDPRYGIICGAADFLGAEMGIEEAQGETREGLELHVYEGMAHSIGAEEMRDLVVWLKKVLPA